MINPLLERRDYNQYDQIEKSLLGDQNSLNNIELSKDRANLLENRAKMQAKEIYGIRN